MRRTQRRQLKLCFFQQGIKATFASIYKKKRKFNEADDPGGAHELFCLQMISMQQEIEEEQYQRLQDRAREQQRREQDWKDKRLRRWQEKEDGWEQRQQERE